MIDFRLSWLDGILGCLRKLVGFAAAGESKIGIQETPRALSVVRSFLSVVKALTANLEFRLTKA